MSESALVMHLRAARALIAHGWTQNAMYWNSAGTAVDQTYEYEPASYCVEGAICWTDSEPEERLLMIELVRKAAGTHLLLGTWNDAPGRTKAEVLRAIDAAIRAASVPSPSPKAKRRVG